MYRAPLHHARSCVAAALSLIGTHVASGQGYEWTTFAGSNGGLGFRDGPAGVAGFKNPRAVACDQVGNIYLTDTGSHTIRKISPAGIFSTLAGKGGFQGSVDGLGDQARFSSPGGVAIDGAGNVYVADTGNHTIRRISPAGAVITLAGAVGVSGSSDGTGTVARFFSPFAITVAADGNLFVADTGNHLIRKITPGGTVTTVAAKPGIAGSTDGSVDVALFRTPRALTTDDEGSIYVADTFNRVVRKITTAGNVTTLAGLAGSSGNVDAVGSAARFGFIEGILVNSSHDVFVADARSIRVIAAADGRVSTLAGTSATAGRSDGSGADARFTRPAGMAMGNDGSMILADPGNHTVRKVTFAGVVTTIAANSTAEAGATDATGTAARFSSPFGITVDGGGSFYIADTGNRTIRKISPSGAVSTFAGSAGLSGTTDATGDAARFMSPRAVTLGPGGIAYVADVVSTHDSTVRKITPAGAVTTLAGTPGSLGQADTLYLLSSLAVNSSGDVFASDLNSIRKITPQGVASVFAGRPRLVTILSGGGFILFWNLSEPADGVGTAATFRNPSGVAIDGNGNLFITDSGASVIRKVTPSRVATTLAGKYQGLDGIPGSNDGTASAARFKEPHGIAVDALGNLYIADSGNHTIRRMSPAGVVTTIGGVPGYTGSGEGIGEKAVFNQPFGIAVDVSGNLYVADTLNHRIVKGSPLPVPDIVLQHPDGSHLASGGTGLEFGSVAPSVASPIQLVTVHNAGNSMLNITQVELAGADVSSFTFNRSALPASIPPNGSGVIAVTFRPDGLGLRSASLRIASDDPDESSVEIALRGTGNRLPVFSGYAVSSPPVSPVSISLTKLLAAATDPDGDSMTVSSVTWPAASGGNLQLQAGSILFYPSSPNFTGTSTFLATITDARGGSVTGNVSVTWQSSTTSGSGSMTTNPPQLTMQAGGKPRVTFHGIPGRSYVIQRSQTLTTWENIANITADPTGNVIFNETSLPLPNAYYRIAIP